MESCAMDTLYMIHVASLSISQFTFLNSQLHFPPSKSPIDLEIGSPGPDPYPQSHL